MTHNPFDTDQKIQEIAAAVLGARTDNTDEVVVALDAAEKLGADARIYLADKFESFIEAMLAGVRDVDMARAIEPMMRSMSRENRAEAAKIFSVVSRTAAFIFNAKADKSAAPVRIYAEEAAKLTDAEYSQPVNHIKLFAAVAEKNALTKQAQPSAPNPFRKNTPKT